MIPRRSMLRVVRAFAPNRRAQLHALARVATCPLRSVLDRLPREGVLLDIGCGHGLVALTAAVEAPTRRILGVDIDTEKLAVASRAAEYLHVHDTVRFGTDIPDEVNGFDAVYCVDVLYLLPATAAHDLIQSMIRAVRPGGRIIIKEMNDRPVWKRRWNEIQEHGATRIFRYTKGATVDVHLPETLCAPLRDAGFRVATARVDRGYPHPHLLIVADAP